MDDFREEGSKNVERLKRLVGLAEGYEKRVKEETELTKDQLKTRYVGKLDPKKRMSSAYKIFILAFPRGSILTRTNSIDLEDVGQRLIEDNIVSVSRQMMDKEASMAKSTDGNINGHNNTAMDVDGEEEL